MAAKSKGGRSPATPGRASFQNSDHSGFGPAWTTIASSGGAKTGRTVSEEIEHRLETSFHDERMALAHTRQRCGCSTFANVLLGNGDRRSRPRLDRRS